MKLKGLNSLRVASLQSSIKNMCELANLKVQTIRAVFKCYNFS